MARPRKFKPGLIVEKEYESSHPQRLFDLLKAGKFNVTIAASLGIAESTFYRWLDEEPDFKKAYDLGRPHRDAHWIEVAEIAIRTGNEKGYKFWVTIMNNLFGWKDKDSATTNNTQINIGSVKVIQNKDDYFKVLEQLKDDAKILDLNILEYMPDDTNVRDISTDS